MLASHFMYSRTDVADSAFFSPFSCNSPFSTGTKVSAVWQSRGASHKSSLDKQLCQVLCSLKTESFGFLLEMGGKYWLVHFTWEAKRSGEPSEDIWQLSVKVNTVHTECWFHVVTTAVFFAFIQLQINIYCFSAVFHSVLIEYFLVVWITDLLVIWVNTIAGLDFYINYQINETWKMYSSSRDNVFCILERVWRILHGRMVFNKYLVEQ